MGLDLDLQLFGITMRDTAAVANAIWEEPIKSDVSRFREESCFLETVR